MAGYESDCSRSSDSLDEWCRRGGFQLSPGRTTMADIPDLGAATVSHFGYGGASQASDLTPCNQATLFMSTGHTASSDPYVSVHPSTSAHDRPGTSSSSDSTEKKRRRPVKEKFHQKGPSDDPEEQMKIDRAKKAKARRDKDKQEWVDLQARCDELIRANQFASHLISGMEAELVIVKDRVCDLGTRRHSKKEELKKLIIDKESHTRSLGYLLSGMDGEGREIEFLRKLHRDMSEK